MKSFIREKQDILAKCITAYVWQVYILKAYLNIMNNIFILNILFLLKTIICITIKNAKFNTKMNLPS